MTNFRFQTFVPQNNLKIVPRLFVKIIYNIFEELKKEDKNVIIVDSIYKKVKKEIENYNFWNKIAADNICCYRYTDRNIDNIARICGKKIDIIYDKNDPNRFLCAKHNRKHVPKYKNR